MEMKGYMDQITLKYLYKFLKFFDCLLLIGRGEGVNPIGGRNSLPEFRFPLKFEGVFLPM